MNILYSLCDVCLYIGTRNRDFYLAHGVPWDKHFFVPYTVDNQSFAARAETASAGREARRVSLGLPPNTPIILYASKLTPRKRPRDLVQAHAELGRRGIRAAVLIVGDGEERVSLEREVMSLGLSHVVFVDFVNQRDLPAYYAMADIYVLPSENEPWGLVINEAMCCGVPVIATREVGASVDLIRDGETGYTFETGDIIGLADALARLITDDKLRSVMRDNCVRRMARWSYTESVQGIRDALRAKPPRPR